MSIGWETGGSWAGARATIYFGCCLFVLFFLFGLFESDRRRGVGAVYFTCSCCDGNYSGGSMDMHASVGGSGARAQSDEEKERQ